MRHCQLLSGQGRFPLSLHESCPLPSQAEITRRPTGVWASDMTAGCGGAVRAQEGKAWG